MLKPETINLIRLIRFGGPGSGPQGGDGGDSSENEISSESINKAAEDDRFKSFKKGTNLEKTLDAYCGRGSQVNYDIREGKLTPASEAFIKNMDNSLNSLPDYKGEVYRGINDPKGAVLSEIKNNVGGVIEWQGYSSTTRDKSKTEDFGKDVFFSIKSKTGKDIEKYSNIKSEQEVLMPRGSKFKIISIEGNQVNLEQI
jgi:hypothetical protein